MSMGSLLLVPIWPRDIVFVLWLLPGAFGVVTR